jgi:hypothetical protein
METGNGYTTYTPRVAFLFPFSPVSILPPSFHIQIPFFYTNKKVNIPWNASSCRPRLVMLCRLLCRDPQVGSTISLLLPPSQPVRAAKPESKLTCLTPIVYFRPTHSVIPSSNAAWLAPNYIHLHARILLCTHTLLSVSAYFIYISKQYYYLGLCRLTFETGTRWRTSSRRTGNRQRPIPKRSNQSHCLPIAAVHFYGWPLNCSSGMLRDYYYYSCESSGGRRRLPLMIAVAWHYFIYLFSSVVWFIIYYYYLYTCQSN